jgi:S1-C subfamily serine protease
MSVRKIAIALLSAVFFGFAPAAARAYFPVPVVIVQEWKLGVFGYIEYAGGFRVTGVVPFSPADKAGIAPGDIVLYVNGQYVRNDFDYARLISRSPLPIVALGVVDGRTGWLRPPQWVDLRQW